MDERVRDQFADGDLGEQRVLFTQGRADMFVLRQQSVEISEQRLEADRIPLLPVVAVGHGRRAVGAVVGHKPYALARHAHVEIGQARREQDGA